MTGLVNLIAQRIQDTNFSNPLAIIDIILATLFVVSFLVYLRKFPVFRVVLGILFLFLCSIIFFWAGFLYTALLFGIVSNLILIALPLIFAPEIRHYLEKLGRFSFLHLPKITENQKKQDFIHNLTDAVYELAERKIGGTIVLQRKTGLGQTIETGVVIDAKFGAKLLHTIFFPKSPLHDGAVVIKDGRIVAAKCLLPINADVKLEPPFGTRHSSGLAITKDTDAVVILISEQRGEVTLAENGKLFINLDRIELTKKLLKLL